MKTWAVLLLCGIWLCSVSYGMDVQCTLVCGDVTGEWVVNNKDFLTAIGSYGVPLISTDFWCLDGVYGSPGSMSLIDILAWDARINNPDLLNLCELPLLESFMTQAWGAVPASFSGSGGPVSGGSLLIAGKKKNSGLFSTDDRIYVLNSQMTFLEHSYAPVSTNKNGRVTTDMAGKVYQINTDSGLVRLDDGVAVVTPGGFSIASDPRYQSNALVFVGLQKNETSYGGRPILDAVVDSQGYVYIAPVVVKTLANPSNSYLAAAKLQLNPGQTPCYSIVRIYDDPPGLNDNQDPLRMGISEIEVDNNGTVYISNSCQENSSDFIWAYPTSGQPTKLALDTYQGVTGGIPDPIALCASKKSSLLYLASAIHAPDSSSTTVYALSTQDFSFTLARTIQINGMGHVTGITEDPNTGNIWVTGFRMQNIPSSADPNQAVFYQPCLVEIPANSNNTVTATQITSSDLGLPVTIAWLPSNLTLAKPANEQSLWRSQNNTIRLTFNTDITTPGAGSVQIQAMQANGQYGSDLSSNFTFTVENNSNGKPRILRIRENGSVLENKAWYAVRNTGSWTGVATFTVQYMTQQGDSTNDGYTTEDDATYSFSGVPSNNCADDDRRDLDGDGSIYMLPDCQAILYLAPSDPVAKPSGH